MSIGSNDGNLLMDDEQKFCCTFDGCAKTYKQKRNLMIHIKLDHCDPNDLHMFECNEEGCGKQFKYKCALNRHNILYHSGAEARELLLAKRRKNTEPRAIIAAEEKRWRVLVGAVESEPDSKLFQCCHDECNRVFTSKGSLNLHIERKHEKPGQFQCPVESCARQFSYKHVLQTHVERTHHMPFNHQDYPNPKRHRTPRNQSSALIVHADESDMDSEDEPLNGRAKRSATGKESKQSALGNLADMAARTASIGGVGGAGVVQLFECDYPGCGKVGYLM